jgi:hypothetical protein
MVKADTTTTDPPPNQCPILTAMRDTAILLVRKRDRPALHKINLDGTKNETLELGRAQILLQTFYPGATIEPHPAGATAALVVATVPYIGKQHALPDSSATRRKLFVAIIEKALQYRLN